MEEQFVTHEIALKLKELGFDKPCFDSYYKESPEYGDNIILWKYGYDNFGREEYIWNILCDAPLWQQAIDWLREKRDTVIDLKYKKDALGWNGYNRNYFIIKNGLNKIDSRGKFENIFYDNEISMKEEAILKALEL